MDMKQPIVSVIIPIYKVEKYMDKCINSVTKQTFNNLEIILVDDGSPDNSGRKCDDWKNKDSRIVVIHQKNSGVSTARNSGINIANGKYIVFVDSDDWLPLDAIEKLVSCAEKNNLDFVMGTAVAIGTVSKEIYGDNMGMLFQKSDLEQFMIFTDIIKTQLGPWAKLYRMETIKNNDLSFPINIAYGEDKIFNWKYLQKCQSFATIPNLIYYYSQLNLSRACSKYYPEVGFWMGEVVKSYIPLFPGKTEKEIINVSNTIVSQFELCCIHYYENIGQYKELYYSKIKDTQSIFMRIIEEYFGDSNLLLVNIKGFSLIFETDVSKVCEHYSSNHSSSIHPWFKRTVRNIIVKIKQFFLYRI